MPNNGAAACLPFPESAPPSTSSFAQAATGKPAAAPGAAAGIEITIGTAMADATEAVAAGLLDWAAGGAMTPATRTLNGERLGRVAQLQLDSIGELPNFGEVALTEGRRVLLARHGAVLYRHYGAAGETVLDELLGHVIGIAEKVVRTELAFRAN